MKIFSKLAHLLLANFGTNFSAYFLINIYKQNVISYRNCTRFVGAVGLIKITSLVYVLA